MGIGGRRLGRINQSLVRATLTGAIAACLPAYSALAQTTLASDAVSSFNIPAGDLAGALDRFSTQGGIQLVYQPELVAGKQAQAFTGRTTWRETLDQLLQGSGLEYQQVNGKTIVIRRAQQPATPATRPRAAATPAAAAASEEARVADPVVLDNVIVSGSRLPVSVTSFPGSVTVIDRQTIEAQAEIKSDVASMLAFEVPGLATTQATSSSNNDQRLRGRKVAVYIDGVPVSAPLRNAGRDFRVLDASAIGGIEVIRGSTALYGTGGAGGSINYLTKRPSGAYGLHGSTQVAVGASLTHASDSFNPLIRQSLELVQGGFDFIFAGSYEEYHGFFDANGDRIPSNPDGNGGVSDSTIVNLYAKAGYSWANQRIEASYLRYDQDQDSDYMLRVPGNQQAGIPTTAAPGQVDPRDQQDFNVNNVAQVSYAHDDVLSSKLRFQVYHQDIRQQFSWNATRASNSTVQSEKSGVRLDLDTPLGWLGGGTLLWGAEYATDESVQTVTTTPVRVWVPQMNQTTKALFAQMQTNVTDRFSVQGGVRHDRFDLRIDDFTVLTTGLEVMGGNADYQSTSLNLGATLKVTDSVSLYGGFSQGFSLPDIGTPLRATTDPNPMVNITPEPVEIDNFDLGLRFHRGGVEATLAGFFNTSDLGELFIQNPDAPPGVRDLIVTRQAQDFWGVEATLAGPLPAARGRWGSTFTWIDGEQDTNGDGKVDGPIDNTSVPPIKVTLFADYQVTKNWSLRAQMLYSGTRNEFPDIADTSSGDHGRVKSLYVVDVSTRFALGPGEMFIAVSNLFNRQYFPTSSTRSGNQVLRFAAAPGAIAKVGYTIRF